ncbi:MAG: hypothetical protein ACI9BW_002131 [Gammaproteobacteria bacterium]|jgi:hypothetical protein
MNTRTDNANSDLGDPVSPNKVNAEHSVGSADQRILKDSKVPDPGGAEYGGPAGLEPTRYGDWESKGRCIDF